MLCLIELLAYWLLRFLVDSMIVTPPAILFQFHFIRRVSLVLHRRIIAILALGAGKRNDFSHTLTFPLQTHTILEETPI